MKISKTKVELAMARKELAFKNICIESGLSQQTVREALKKGKALPATAGKIAKALGVDVTELLED